MYKIYHVQNLQIHAVRAKFYAEVCGRSCHGVGGFAFWFHSPPCVGLLDEGRGKNGLENLITVQLSCTIPAVVGTAATVPTTSEKPVATQEDRD